MKRFYSENCHLPIILSRIKIGIGSKFGIKKFVLLLAVTSSIILGITFFFRCSVAKNLLGIVNPPEIRSLILSSYEVNPGDTVQVTVDVSDESGDVLQYEWSATAGQFLLPTNRATVQWKAPVVGGTYTISVEVSNDEESSSQSQQVTVRSFVNPYVQIQTPAAGSYFTQFQVITIQGVAQHDNGIQQVDLYVRDQLKASQGGRSDNTYTFTYGLTDAGGLAEIKMVAIAEVTNAVGRDSVYINIEGIVIGK